MTTINGKTDISKRLGYGGSAVIGSTQVLITSGSFEITNNPAYNTMIDIAPNTQSRSKVLHADGTSEYTASIGFDVTSAAMSLLTTSTLLGRRYLFSLGIHDGENKFVMTDCFATQLTLSGAPGGLITANLSAMGKTAWTAGTVTNDFIRNTVRVGSDLANKPLGYWWSGGPDIRDWTLTMTQSVTPMYRNLAETDPGYLKVGPIEYVLAVNLYAYPIADNKAIHIATKTFNLTGVSTSLGYSFNGITDLGTYSHTFTTSATGSDGSNGVIIA